LHNNPGADERRGIESKHLVTTAAGERSVLTLNLTDKKDTPMTALSAYPSSPNFRAASPALDIETTAKAPRRLSGPSLALLAAACLAAAPARATTIEVDEDVMTSPFFTGSNRVRGYGTDNRELHRVSTDSPFGSPGAETVYLSFNYDFAGNFSGPVKALLNLQSVEGGFGADASAATPFLVSAHAVDANPLTAIVDDTNPSGTTDWLSFYNSRILPADAAASTSINGFGNVQFDVSAIVNDWISGGNSIFVIALTGKNDSSGNDFLHGFLNSSAHPGSTFLSVSQVPLPGGLMLMISGLATLVAASRKSRPAAL